MSRRTALLVATATFDWAAAFLLFVAVFATFDGRTNLSLAFLGGGLLSTLLARFFGGLNAP